MGGYRVVLRELTQLNGVSGDEGAVRKYIIDKAKELGAAVRVDRIGNVIATKAGKGKDRRHVLFAAHMDEIGMIVVGIEDSGLLCYETVGGIHPKVMVSKHVSIGAKAVPGVIGAKAIHLQSPADRKAMLEHRQLFIDIGAKDKSDAEKLVSPGDYVCPASEYEEFGDGMVKSKALDDRIGCYNLLRILESDYADDVTCAFTVQEEIGLHGAKVLANQIQPDCAIILEATAANDLGDVDEHLRVCTLGNGVAISFMDLASIAHPGLNRALRDAANREGIAWQVKTFVSGGNDAGALQTLGGAVRVCVLSVPCRYIHSHSNVCSMGDIEAQYELAKAFAKSSDWGMEP